MPFVGEWRVAARSLETETEDVTDVRPSCSDVFTAIADSTRRDLLLRLASGDEQNVTTLLQPYAVSQPTISKHLRVLRDAGLVRARKEGRSMMYRIEPGQLREVHDWIAHFERYWDEKLDALGEFLDKRQRSRRSGK